MLKQFSSHKNLIISIAVVLVLVIFGWWYFGNSSSPSSDDILSSSTATSSDTLLATLNQLKGLSLDSSIFSSPAFEALNDNTVILPMVQSGRPNPFAPLSGAASTSNGLGTN
jgi:hypothetical protein